MTSSLGVSYTLSIIVGKSFIPSFSESCSMNNSSKNQYSSWFSGVLTVRAAFRKVLNCSKLPWSRTEQSPPA
jgi:hypothetical protein